MALATVFAGCRESLEAPFIYHPSREMTVDPSSVALPFRDVGFTAADGVKLDGWLIPGRERTTLLYSHGNGGNISKRVDIARVLHDQLGVGLFLYDYRGYGRSEGTPTQAGIVRDAVAARDALLREGVAPQDVIYLGRSLGAAVSIDLALAHPPRGLVLEAPFSSMRAMANHTIPGVGYLFGDRWDSISKIPRLRAPLLVLHGDSDEVIPYAQGRAIFAAAPEPKTFFTIRGGYHYDMDPKWPEYWAAWREFLAGLPAMGPTRAAR